MTVVVCSDSYQRGSISEKGLLWGFSRYSHMWLADAGINRVERVGEWTLPTRGVTWNATEQSVLYCGLDGNIWASSLTTGESRVVLTVRAASIACFGRQPKLGLGSPFVWLARGHRAHEYVALLRDDGQWAMIWFDDQSRVAASLVLPGQSHLSNQYSSTLDAFLSSSFGPRPALVGRDGKVRAELPVGRRPATRNRLEIRHVAFREDGSHVAIGLPNGMILWDLHREEMLEMPTGGEPCPSWSVDGDLLAYVVAGQELRLVESDSTETLASLHAGSSEGVRLGSKTKPAFSRDGRYLAAVLVGPPAVDEQSAQPQVTVVVDRQEHIYEFVDF